MADQTFSNQSPYDKLLDEFPDFTPDAVEACIQCLEVAASINLKKEELCGQFGLTPGKLSLLMLLWQGSGRALSPSELADRAQVTRATVTHFLDALQGDRLIRRASNPEDRRGMRIVLTTQGEALLKRFLPAHLARMERIAKVLSRAERRQLIGLMGKLSRGVHRLEIESVPEV